MPDERNARPVSGEIMTSGAARETARAAAPLADVVDADFETLCPGPADRLVPASPLSSIGTVEAPSQGLGTLRKNEDHAVQRAARGGPAFWVIGLGLVAGAFWISGGHAVVRQTSLGAPAQQVGPANPLRISAVASRVEDHGGRKIVFVDGKALNQGTAGSPLPPIEISVIANDGSTTRYNLGTSQEPLAAGGEFSFSSRFEAPKEGVKSVSVSFRE